MKNYKHVLYAAYIVAGLLCATVHGETIQLGGDSAVRTAGWLDLAGESGVNNVQPFSYTDPNGITFTVTATANAGQTVNVLNYGLAVMGGASDSRIDGTESLELTLSVSGGNLSDLSASFLVGSLGTGEGIDVTDGASSVVIAEPAADLVEYGSGNGLDGLTALSTGSISTWSIKFSPNAAYPNTKAILNALILDYTVNTDPPPYYPLYAEAAQLYSNSTPYDLSSESYAYSEIYRTPCYPVGGTVNEDHGTPIVSYGDSTYVVFADAGRRIKIAKITDGNVEETYLDHTLYQTADFYANSDTDANNNIAGPDYYRMKADDSHHELCIGVDKYGYIHIAGDMHNFPDVPANNAHLPLRYFNSHCLYWRSDNPGDISSFSFKGDDPDTCPQGYGITYLEFSKDLEGELFFTSRSFQGDPSNRARRAQATSRYDAENGTWSIIGGKAFEPDGYDVTFWEDNAENGGSYVKMYGDMTFDRQNRMHLATGMLNVDAPAAVPVYAVLTDLLYLQSTDGGATMKKTDGTVVSMPARVETGANQAEIIYTTDYLSDPDNAEYLNAKVQVGHDISDNPYVLCTPKLTDGLTATSLTPKLFGWSSGGGWTDHGDVVPAYEYFFSDPAGVMTAINGDDVYRLWAPGSVKTIATGWSGQLRGYDREYIKKTGNIQVICQDTATDELVVTRMEIARPGLQLIDPPAEAVTNLPPEITTAASFDGTSLSVAATDADGAPLTYTWSMEYSSTTGTVTFSENGTAAAANTVPTFSKDGTYVLKVTISDGTNLRIATVSFYATINTAPQWDDDPFDSSVAMEDVAYVKYLNWRVTDPDNDPLEFALVSDSDWLSMANPSNGKIEGTPTQADVGTNTFTMSVSDGVNPAVEATMHIVVNNVNDTPVFTPNLIVTADAEEGVAYSASISNSVADEDGDALIYSQVGSSWLTVAADGTLSGTPDVSGTNTFTVQVDDGNGGSDTATLQIYVEQVIMTIGVTLAADEANSSPSAWGGSITNTLNDPFAFDPLDPTAALPLQTWSSSAGFHGGEAESNDVVLVYHLSDGALVPAAGAVFAVDLYGRNKLNERCQDVDIQLYRGGAGGTLVAFTNGVAIPDVEPYYVRVGIPAESTFDTVMLVAHDSTVADDQNAFSLMEIRTTLLGEGTLGNTAPIANDDNVTLDEDSFAAITLTGSDPDGQPIVFTVLATSANGTYANGIYTPDADYYGSDAIVFEVSDGSLAATGTISIMVNAVNDAPIANDDSVSLDEDGSVAIALTGSDIDGDGLSYNVVSGPANGTFDGSTYTPNANYNGSDSFTFVANDGTADSAPATVSITINAVNDVPMVGNASAAVDEDGSVAIALTGSDIDGDALTYSVATAPANGTFDGTTYTPNANFNGSDLFTFIANDGTVDSAPATITIAVAAVNDAPTFSMDPIIGTPATQDVVYADSITGTDVDGDSLSYSKVDGPVWLAVAANGALSGTPVQGDVGLNSFTLLADDGHGGTTSTTLEIEVFAGATVSDPVELLVNGSFESGAANFDFTGVYVNLPLTVDMVGQWVSRESNEDTSMDLADISGILAGQDGSTSMMFQSSAKRGLVQVVDVSQMDVSGLELAFSVAFAAPGREALTSSDMACYQVVGFNDLAGMTVDIGGSYAFTGGTYDELVTKRNIDDAELSGSSYTPFSETVTLENNYKYIAVLVGGLADAYNDDTQYVAVDNIELKLEGSSLLPAADYALSETNWAGSVSGSLVDIDLGSSNVYEVITEKVVGTVSQADHQWLLEVHGAELVTFYVEAHHTANSEGDDFIFAFSSNGTDWTDMVTVTKTADNDTVQWYALPSGLSGAVYVRATDTDRTAGNSMLDSLLIDAMFIVSDESAQVPLAANTPVPADGAADIPVDQVLGWTAGSMTATNGIYFGTDSGNLIFQTLELGNSFDPGGLNPATTYYWAVDAMNSSGTTPGTVWSLTTASDAWTELTFDDFEVDWGNWVDGGDQVQLKSNYAVGSQCLNIADNLGDGSSTWLAGPLNLSPYSELRINFTYLPVSMESGEDFWLMFSDDGGSSWQTLKTFIAGVDFSNDIREYPELIVDSANYNFTSNTLLRFQCDASGAWDDIYLDDISISAK